MYKGIYKIADTVIEIRSLYEAVQKMCIDYQVGDEPEVIVSTTLEDIEFERMKSAKEYELEDIPPVEFSDDYLETLAVYRKIVVQLLDKDLLLFHGSAIAVDGEAYLFTAKSGTGKSTHTRLWRERFGDRAVMVNDDKPLIRIVDVPKPHAIVYGTPWDGKHRLSCNCSVPLSCICILERGAENQIQPLTEKEALTTLFQQSYRPQEEEKMGKTLELVLKLGLSVRLYRLRCNMNPEAADVAYKGMQI